MIQIQTQDSRRWWQKCLHSASLAHWPGIIFVQKSDPESSCTPSRPSVVQDYTLVMTLLAHHGYQSQDSGSVSLISGSGKFHEAPAGLSQGRCIPVGSRR